MRAPFSRPMRLRRGMMVWRRARTWVWAWLVRPFLRSRYVSPRLPASDFQKSSNADLCRYPRFGHSDGSAVRLPICPPSHPNPRVCSCKNDAHVAAAHYYDYYPLQPRHIPRCTPSDIIGCHLSEHSSSGELGSNMSSLLSGRRPIPPLPSYHHK